ncbi:aromatic ring-hydroxylating dioxygenase subunit alpha [Novosphingobium resinovorum]
MTEPEAYEPSRLTAADMDAEVLATYPTEAFLSKDYLAAEKTLLWPKVWQMVERESDLPNPGDWLTYDVADESVIVLRKDDGSLKAFHNVCPHRGRQLVSVPDMLPGKVHDVRGSNRRNFICGFHGWTFDLEGQNTYILDPQDWQNKLTAEMTCLSEVQVDTWGGYIYITMDPDAVPLAEWMGRAGKSSVTSSWRRCTTSGASGRSTTATGRLRSRRSSNPTTSRARIPSCWPMAITMR